MINKKLVSLIIILVFLVFNKSFSQIIDSNEKWIKVSEGLNFPEGPAYDSNSSIYFSNCNGGWIGNYHNSILDTFLSKNNDSLLIAKTNGLGFGDDGILYICEYGKGRILSVNQNHQIDVYASGYNGVKFNRPNDLTFDVNMNLFFTDPNNYDKNILDGRIFVIDKITKEVMLVADCLAFPNGINISPIDGRLYVCESAKQKIIRFDITPTNNLINKEDFIELPGGDPDGIEFDEKGNLYVAHFGGKAIYIFSTKGKLLQKIETPGTKPTNLEFGDRDYKSLYLTEVETNSLYKIRTNIPGKNKP